MAVAILRDVLRRRKHDGFVAVNSAGIWASEGQPATAEVQQVMQERGLDVSDHRAHNLTLADVRRADLIIAMEKGIAEAVAIEAPEQKAKIYTLGDLADDPRDVEDPMGGSLEDYRYTAEELQAMLQRAYGRILSLLGLSAAGNNACSS